MFDKKNLTLLPIFFIYIILCIFLADAPPKNDQWTYIGYAKNLSNGFYVPPDSLRIWCGPGYPLFLAPFAKLSIPWIVAKYFNALFVFGGVCFLFLALRQYIPSKKSLCIAYLFALYPPMLIEIPKILTESISIFFVTGFIYFIILSFRSGKWRNYLLAGIFCSLIVLTKVIYAYVVLGALITSLLLCIKNKSFIKLAGIYLFAFALCSPYLFYTRSITGKLFYWANSGGSTLYWMSSPYSGELGDWKNENIPLHDKKFAHHKPLFLKLSQHNAVEKDSILKQEAIKNIRKHPKQYLQNWICNIGRMWVNYPYAYKYQRPHTMVYTVPNCFLLTGCLLVICPFLKRLKYLPPEVITLTLFAGIFLAGSSLVYSCSRYLVTIVPVLVILVSYGLFVLLKIEFRPKSELNDINR